MSKCIHRNHDYLSVLGRCSSRERSAIIKHANKDLLLAISEVALNIAQQNIPLSSSQLSALRRHKQLLQLIASKKVSHLKKRKLLVQKGGFLPLLLAPLLSLLGGLAGKGIAKAVGL